MRTTRYGCLVLMGCLVAEAVAQNPPPPPPPAPSLAPQIGRPVPLPQRPPPSVSNPLTFTPPPAEVPPEGAVVQPSDPVLGSIYPFDVGAAPPGWFFNVEVDLLWPTSSFRVTTEQKQPNTGLTLDAPATGLDMTFSPTFEVGYRLPDSGGLFALSYSFLFADGSGTVTNSLGQLNVTNNVNIQWLDLDYGTVPYEIAPRWDLSWRLGARVAKIYFKSSATGPGGLSQVATSDMLGAGPHARFDLERRIVPVEGLSLFSRLDGAVLVGLIDQDYTLQKGGLSDTGSVRLTQSVPYVNVQGGLSYAPPVFPNFKITAGYLFEEYFRGGKLSNEANGAAINGRGNFWSHGPFLRGQLDF